MANEHLIHIKTPTLYNYKGELLNNPKKVQFPKDVGTATFTNYNVPPTAGLTLYVCGDTVDIYKRKYDEDPNFFVKGQIRRIAMISNDEYGRIQDRGVEKIPVDYTLLEIDYQERQGKKQTPTIDPLEAMADNLETIENSKPKDLNSYSGNKINDYIEQEEAKIGQFLRKGTTKIK